MTPMEIIRLGIEKSLHIEVHAGVHAADQSDAHFRITRNRDRAIGQGVRRNRHQRNGRQARMQNRSAARQGVGGRPGGGTDDDAVGA